jgi:hypothetical protein
VNARRKVGMFMKFVAFVRLVELFIVEAGEMAEEFAVIVVSGNG